MNSIDALSVIFVDDEQSVLDGIKRLMRRLHPTWNVQYIADPMAALLEYRKSKDSLDVIVCDINMPGISGLQILQAVHDHSPRVIRIALTGQLDVRTVMGTSKFADCHMCKPVDFDALCSKITELHGLRSKGPAI